MPNSIEAALEELKLKKFEKFYECITESILQGEFYHPEFDKFREEINKLLLRFSEEASGNLTEYEYSEEQYQLRIWKEYNINKQLYFLSHKAKSTLSKSANKKIYVNPKCPSLQDLLNLVTTDAATYFDSDENEDIEGREIISVFQITILVKLAELELGHDTNKDILRELIGLYEVLNNSEFAIANLELVRQKILFFIFKIQARFKEEKIEVNLFNQELFDYQIVDDIGKLLTARDSPYKSLVEKINNHYINFGLESIDNIKIEKLNTDTGTIESIHRDTKLIRKSYKYLREGSLSLASNSVSKLDEITDNLFEKVKSQLEDSSLKEIDIVSWQSAFTLVSNAKLYSLWHKLHNDKFKNFHNKINELNSIEELVNNKYFDRVSPFMPFITICEIVIDYFRFLLKITEVHNIEKENFNKAISLYKSSLKEIEKYFIESKLNKTFCLNNEFDKSFININNGKKIFVDSWYYLPSNYSNLENRIQTMDNDYNTLRIELLSRASALSEEKIDEKFKQRDDIMNQNKDTVEKNLKEFLMGETKTIELRLTKESITTLAIFTALISFLLTSIQAISVQQSPSILFSFFFVITGSLVFFIAVIFAIFSFWRKPEESSTLNQQNNSSSTLLENILRFKIPFGFLIVISVIFFIISYLNINSIEHIQFKINKSYSNEKIDSIERNLDSILLKQSKVIKNQEELSKPN